MPIKVTIGRREVTNPFAKFLIAFAGVMVLMVACTVVFFLILPLVWFLVLSILLLVVILLVAAPKLVTIYQSSPRARRPEKTLGHDE